MWKIIESSTECVMLLKLYSSKKSKKILARKLRARMMCALLEYRLKYKTDREKVKPKSHLGKHFPRN